jgi:hypothetical protein
MSPGVKRPGHEDNPQLKLVPRSRKCGSVHPLPHTPSWNSALLDKVKDNFTIFIRICLFDALKLSDMNNSYKREYMYVMYNPLWGCHHHISEETSDHTVKRMQIGGPLF